jgi:hypothetical protein
MAQMQTQMQEFVATLNRELAAHSAPQAEQEGRNWLVPVINARPSASSVVNTPRRNR